MEGRNICIAFHFAGKSASVGCVCRKCVSSRLVTVFQLRQIHNDLALSLADGLKTGFSSLCLLRLPANLLLCFPFGGLNNAEYVLLYSFKNKRGQ